MKNIRIVACFLFFLCVVSTSIYAMQKRDADGISAVLYKNLSGLGRGLGKDIEIDGELFAEALRNIQLLFERRQPGRFRLLFDHKRDFIFDGVCERIEIEENFFKAFLPIFVKAADRVSLVAFVRELKEDIGQEDFYDLISMYPMVDALLTVYLDEKGEGNFLPKIEARIVKIISRLGKMSGRLNTYSIWDFDSALGKVSALFKIARARPSWVIPDARFEDFCNKQQESIDKEVCDCFFKIFKEKAKELKLIDLLRRLKIDHGEDVFISTMLNHSMTSAIFAAYLEEEKAEDLLKQQGPENTQCEEAGEETGWES